MFTPNDSIILTCWSSSTSCMTGVAKNSPWVTAMMPIVMTNAPSTRGRATMAA